MKLLLHPNIGIWNFEMEGLADRIDVLSLPLNSYCYKWQIVFRKLFKFNSLHPFFLFNKKLVKILKELKKGDIVIICDYSLPCIYYSLRKCCKSDVKIYFWLWNPTTDDEQFEMKKEIIERLNVQICTFDPGDAKKYNLKLLNQFYPIKKYKSDFIPKLDCDFYFLGSPKDRMLVINEVKNHLITYKTKFIIPSNPSEYISYKENIENCKKTKCIIDLIQKSQSGMTLRFLEALTFRRKLLTNDVLLTLNPLYSKDNVFIWGVDDFEELDDFLNKPYDLSVEKNINKHDVNYWIDSF